MAEIAVIGAGYVGLTTGTCLSELGHNVTIVDIEHSRIESLREGIIPFVEPSLAGLVSAGIKSGKLKFVHGSEKACKDADFIFICLPTPSSQDGSTDLSIFESGINQIADIAKPDSTLIIKSTVPVGTASKIKDQLQRADLAVVSNPEFLAEGSAVKDFLEPSRIVIGAVRIEDAERVAELYEKIEAPVLTSSWESAEIIKHTANAFLALKLTFINEIATLCEKTGADIQEVTLGIGLDPRIGSNYLNPGPGWGGSCFPKDSSSLAHVAREVGFDFTLLEHTIELNQEHLSRTAKKVTDALPKDKQTRKIAAWGLTFKAGTDDLRSSPAIEILKKLTQSQDSISVFDPTVKGELAALPEILVEADPYLCAKGADVLVVLTEWKEFRELDMALVAQNMYSPILVDTRNLFKRHEMEKLGFIYYGMGT